MKFKNKGSKRTVEKKLKKKRKREGGREKGGREERGGGRKGREQKGMEGQREIMRKRAEDRKIKILKKLSRWEEWLKGKRR